MLRGETIVITGAGGQVALPIAESLAAENPELAPLAARFTSLIGGSEALTAEEPKTEEKSGGDETPKRRR